VASERSERGHWSGVKIFRSPEGAAEVPASLQDARTFYLLSQWLRAYAGASALTTGYLLPPLARLVE